jgi:protein NRD1
MHRQQRQATRLRQDVLPQGRRGRQGSDGGEQGSGTKGETGPLYFIRPILWACKANSVLQTRWGVGFGPRDCSDYQSGISIIPIHKLTEADRKWMLTAPFGGSGGRPIVSGLSVEEPDIEIGAGVSSKAISRRMQTDKGGNHGPKSSRENSDPVNGIPVAERGGGGGRWRHGREKRNSGASDHRRDDRDGKGGPSDEPVVLGLPAGITMGPNGINYPPNFAFS